MRSRWPGLWWIAETTFKHSQKNRFNIDWNLWYTLPLPLRGCPGLEYRSSSCPHREVHPILRAGLRTGADRRKMVLAPRELKEKSIHMQTMTITHQQVIDLVSTLRGH